MASTSVSAWVPTRSPPSSARAAWVRSIAPATPSCTRDLALKVLPEVFTSHPDRLARFEREAKVLASLRHAGIVL